MAEKKNLLTREGLRKLEDELQDLKVNRRQEIAQKIKEAREQGDLSENAEYDAAKDEQRDIEARIEEIEKILKTLSEDESYGMILRAKGMLESEDGVWTYFDMVPEEYEVREGQADYTGRVCVIGTDLKEEDLVKLFHI